ncbi:hypothetical protein AU192_05865 [Mycobacterium lehmannii]|uniref:DUF732 domain-containing protein n=1 Tax=Mycobacterium lehmannii TaxID=2048550 RepID=A0A101AAW0_9MYCO|nr:DUF732 domain-containing protein [Mycobacterium lehmannii]KUI19287.1 hypothetical protein AU192_05865 [Mycobacterium lehmannii]
MQRSVRTTAAGSLLIASATALLTGCSGPDVMAAMGLPTSETAPAPGQPAEPMAPPSATGHSNTLVLTDRQRGYLDALTAAGVKPSSELLALRVGSYVCQARAARHDDQKVWDSIYPLVRGDAMDHISGRAPTVNVDAATADYIRIATERLC